MTTCNGWRNANTWTVNLWFGDTFATFAEEGEAYDADMCKDFVETMIEEIVKPSGDSLNGFIWDMLDLSSVDWEAIAEHNVYLGGKS